MSGFAGFRWGRAALAALVALAGCATSMPPPSNADLVRQVADTERAFAKTMADRDHAAFATFLSDEAVFFTGPTPLHGKAAVAAAWKRFYEGAQPPFSWEPDKVEVLASGTLALSSGPVRDRNGKLVATFTSIWRQDAPGVWHIIFDKGNEVCDCPKTP
ncbi:MAG: nuclear transport factor 2 family protein [Burkholderiales bacterium]